MEQKLPYYMVYPMPFLYDDERQARRDMEYMKGLYPETAKRLTPYVEEECDRLMYDGSMIYDEYPDPLQLRLICRRVFDRASEDEEKPGSWMQDLIQVMTYQEILRRRSEYRSSKRRFY
nr:hypothetical protein [uncultured Merdimonas sp.]